MVFEIPGQWSKKDGSYISEIPPKTLFPIARTMLTDQPQIELEVLEVQGVVYFSSNGELIKKLHLPSIGPALSKKETEQMLKKLSQQLIDLKSIRWESLTLDHQLRSWDMIWIQHNSRVEVEVLEKGQSFLIDQYTSVKDAAGHFTMRNRFPENSFWILVPDEVRAAKVNKIIGTVLVAADREMVKTFYSKYEMSSRLRPMDGPTQAKWLELLKKQELE